MKTTTALLVAAAFAAGGIAGAFAWFGKLGGAGGPALHPAWTEVQWPFPVDEWGRGKAFRCKAADCGTDVTLYLRAKIGFCNCTTGVADDEELERLSDFKLVGERLAAVGDGRAIKVAWMKGRSRTYKVGDAGQRGSSALSVAFNDRCDAIVATVALGPGRPSELEPAVIAFLNGETVMRWAEVTLGL